MDFQYNIIAVIQLGQFHIIHLISHHTSDEIGQNGRILWEDQERKLLLCNINLGPILIIRR